ncbi:ATP-binding protein [Allorhizobium undicola]|uniref:ATP-binding protein n=1 Tax=Allorhizobium undicola TaxID=78527 RepID=UPI003D34F998
MPTEDRNQPGEDGRTASAAKLRMPSRLRGLSGKLLALTVIFVLLAEVLIFAPSISSMRLNWLRNHLNKSAAAAVVIDGLQSVEIPAEVQRDILSATGTRAIVLRKDGTTRLLAVSEMPQQLDAQYDLAEMDGWIAIRDALEEIAFGGERTISVSAPIGESSMQVEVVMNDSVLRKAMLQYSTRVAIFSLLISLMTGALLFISVNRLLIRPVRRLTHNIESFARDPENPASVIRPFTGRDELAFVAAHLASMQTQLQKTLRQQRNLADLGLAVSKINHDMRNILASAQLMSDRLADIDDPIVKSFAPKLVRAIDRAVSYSTDVLTFGQAPEAAPKRRRFPLHSLCQDLRDMLALGADIEFVDQIAEDLEVDADSEQLLRVIHNLCRNAAQALSGFITESPGGMGRITLSGQRIGSVVAITIDDNGPGMPQKARENLFSAFRGSARSGGTGLGLVIARELVLAHGGTIALVEKPGAGTQFRIEIPDLPAMLEDFRLKAKG